MNDRSAQSREDIRRRFMDIDTSNVADVLDSLGHPDYGLAPGLVAAIPGAGKLAGWAYTIQGQMTPYKDTGDPQKMQACQGMGPGEVSVWSGDGEGICYFGELIAIGMKERGSVGALVNGGIRDVRWIAAQGFPVFARYRSSVQSIGRWKVNAWQIPVSLPGATTRAVTISPGDFILGDEDGAIAIPAPLVDQVLLEAEKLTRMEVQVREDLKNGLTLAKALEKYGHV